MKDIVLKLRIEGDAKSGKAEVSQLRAELDQAGKAGDAAGKMITESFDQTTKAVSTTNRQLDRSPPIIRTTTTSATQLDRSLSNTGRTAQTSSRQVQTGFRGANQAATSLNDTIDSSRRGLDELGDSNGPNQAANNIDTLRTAVNGAVGIFALGELKSGIADFVDLTDTVQGYESQIQLATETQSQFDIGLTGVRRIASDAGAAIESTASLYTRLENSTKNTAFSQGDLLRTTQAVTRSFAISGATTAEYNSAVIQLGQGLASGTLRGDELNSVFEAAPRLVEALEDALGKTRSEIRQMAADGQITSEIIINALLSQSDAIDKEFESLGPRVSRSLQRVRNSFEELVADSSTVRESMESVSEGMDFVAEHIDTLDTLISALSLGLVTFAGRQGLLLTQRGFNAVFESVASVNQEVRSTGPILNANGQQIARSTRATTTWARSMNVARAAGVGLFSLVGGWPTIIAGVAVGLSTLADHIQDTERRANEAAKRARAQAAEAAVIRESQRLQNRRENPNLIRDDIAAAERQLRRALPRANSDSITSGQAAEKVKFLRDELRKLNDELQSTSKEGQTARNQFTAVSESIDKQIKSLDEQRIKLEQGTTGVNRYAAAQIDQSKLTEEQREQLNKLLAKLDDAEAAVKKLKEQTEAETKAQRDAARAKREAAQAAERIAQQAKRASEQLLDIDRERSAQLAGPLAVAELAHVQRLEELEKLEQDLLAAGVLTLEQLMQLARARENSQVELDRETQSIRDRQASASDEIGIIDREIKILQTKGTARRELINALEIEDRIERIKQARAQQGLPLGEEEIKQIREKLILLNDLEDAADFDLRSIVADAAEDGFADASLSRFYESLTAGIGKAFEQGSTSARLSIIDQISGGALGALDAFTAASNPFEGALSVAQQIPGEIGQVASIISNTVGVFKKIFGFGKLPRIKLGGAESGITPDDKTDTTFFTDLGEVRIELRKFKVEDLDAFVDSVRQFDNTLADIVGQDRVGAVADSLRTFFTSEKGKDVRIEDVLDDRFDAVLASLDDRIIAQVRSFGGTLEQQIQRLAEVVAIDDALVDDADLFGVGSTLAEVVSLLDDLGDAGETLPDTYNRLAQQTQFINDTFALLGQSVGREGEALVRWADEIAESAGGLDRARELWSGFLSNTFFTNDELIGRRISNAQNNTSTELSDIGLNSDTTAEEFRRLFDEQLPTLSGDALVQWLEAAEALNALNQLEQQRASLLSQEMASAQEAAEAERLLAQERANAASNIIQRIEDDLFELDTTPVQRQIQRFDDQLNDALKTLDAAERGEDELSLARARHTAQLSQLQQSLLDDINRDIDDIQLTPIARQIHSLNEELRETEQALIDAQLGESALSAARERHALRLAEISGEFIDDINRDIERLSLAPARVQLLEFNRQLEQAEREILEAGLGEEALARARQRHTLQIRQLTEELSASVQSISSQLFGGDFNLDTAASAATNSVSTLADGLGDLSDVAERIIDTANGLLTDDSITPLSPLQRRDEIERQLELAISSGDFSAVPQLAQELARAIRQTGASSAQADADIFALRERLLALAPQIQNATRPVSAASVDRIESNTANITNAINQSSADQLRLANQLIEELALLSELRHEDALALADRLGVPLERLPEFLALNVAMPQQETARQVAFLAEQLGVGITDLSERFGVELGSLANTNSLLNDALETAIRGLGDQNRTDDLLDALAAVENASSPEQQTAAITQLEAQVSDLPPELANALAPFLDGVRVRDIAEQQTVLLSDLVNWAEAGNESDQRLTDIMQSVRDEMDFGRDIVQQTTLLSDLLDTSQTQAADGARASDLLSDIRANLRESNSSQGLRAFASGGLVAGPTRALIGESGRELVLPNPVTEFLYKHGVPVQGGALDIRPIVTELQDLKRQMNQSSATNMHALAQRLEAVEQAIKRGNVQAQQMHEENQFNQQKAETRIGAKGI